MDRIKEFYKEQQKSIEKVINSMVSAIIAPTDYIDTSLTAKESQERWAEVIKDIITDGVKKILLINEDNPSFFP